MRRLNSEQKRGSPRIMIGYKKVDRGGKLRLDCIDKEYPRKACRSENETGSLYEKV